jgi:hypothetical protein
MKVAIRERKLKLFPDRVEPFSSFPFPGDEPTALLFGVCKRPEAVVIRLIDPIGTTEHSGPDYRRNLGTMLHIDV